MTKRPRILATGSPYSAAALQRHLELLAMSQPTPDQQRALAKAVALQASIRADPERIRERCWLVSYRSSAGPEVALYMPVANEWLDENLKPVVPPRKVRETAERASRNQK